MMRSFASLSRSSSSLTVATRALTASLHPKSLSDLARRYSAAKSLAGFFGFACFLPALAVVAESIASAGFSVA
jgi:hypothetical protein